MLSGDFPTLLDRWRALAGTGSDTVGRDLLARYAEPQRRYHDARHLAEVLSALDLLSNDRVVLLAAWFHDAVYDPRRENNEERSATLAAEKLPRLGVPQPEVAEVTRLVRLTAGHQPAAGDRSGAALSDADLAILGAPQPRYDDYAAAVRAEYAHVADADFAAGRAAVLRDLLGRDRLYRTETGRERWEEPARKNLRRELDRWRPD